MRGYIKKWTRGSEREKKEERREKEIFVIGRVVGGNARVSSSCSCGTRAYVNRIKVDVENMLGPSTVSTAARRAGRSTDRLAPMQDLYFMFL